MIPAVWDLLTLLVSIRNDGGTNWLRAYVDDVDTRKAQLNKKKEKVVLSLESESELLDEIAGAHSLR